METAQPPHPAPVRREPTAPDFLQPRESNPCVSSTLNPLTVICAVMRHFALHSQTNVHQLIQFRAAALVQVSAAGVALVHQISQRPDAIGAGRVTRLLELQHARGFAVHVLRSLVQLETRHWGRHGRAARQVVHRLADVHQLNDFSVCVQLYKSDILKANATF